MDYLTSALRKKYPYLELFWSVFSRIQTEYGEIGSIFPSPYSVSMWENTDQNNSEYGHILRSAALPVIIRKSMIFLWFQMAFLWLIGLLELV